VGTRRVLVTGDSFTFGNGVDHEEAFPRVADTLLRASAEGWEILNLGVSAWGPSNAVAWLETEGAAVGASGSTAACEIHEALRDLPRVSRGCRRFP